VWLAPIATAAAVAWLSAAAAPSRWPFVAEGLLAGAALAVGVRTRAAASWHRRVLLAAALGLALSAVAVAVWGRSRCGSGWLTGVNGRLRQDYRRRVHPDELRRRVALDMSPSEVLVAMGVHTDGWARLRHLFVDGRTLGEVLMAMGVTLRTATPPRGVESREYFVWAYPICGTLGCCDGALAFEFRRSRLRRVAVYSPMPVSSADVHPTSDDLARYDSPGPGRFGRRFSQTKTLAAIMASRCSGCTVIADSQPGRALESTRRRYQQNSSGVLVPL